MSFPNTLPPTVWVWWHVSYPCSVSTSGARSWDPKSAAFTIPEEEDPAMVHNFSSFQLRGFTEGIITANTSWFLILCWHCKHHLTRSVLFFSNGRLSPSESLLRQSLSLGKQSRNYPFHSRCAWEMCECVCFSLSCFLNYKVIHFRQ